MNIKNVAYSEKWTEEEWKDVEGKSSGLCVIC